MPWHIPEGESTLSSPSALPQAWTPPIPRVAPSGSTTVTHTNNTFKQTRTQVEHAWKRKNLEQVGKKTVLVKQNELFLTCPTPPGSASTWKGGCCGLHHLQSAVGGVSSGGAGVCTGHPWDRRLSWQSRDKPACASSCTARERGSRVGKRQGKALCEHRNPQLGSFGWHQHFAKREGGMCWFFLLCIETIVHEKNTAKNNILLWNIPRSPTVFRVLNFMDSNHQSLNSSDLPLERSQGG